MAEINGMFISFPSDYTPEERELILDAFQMANTDTTEKKGFGQFVDLIAASPQMVVVTFVTGAIATGVLRKIGGDIYEIVKKKLSEGFAKKLNAKVRFKIQLGNAELNVEFNIKKMDQLDFVIKNITELIRKHEIDGLTNQFQTANYWVTDDNNWEKKIPSGQAPGEIEKKGVPGQNYRNLYVFPPEEDDSEHEYKVFRQKAIENNPYHTAVITLKDKEEFEKMLELRKSVYIDELGWIPKEDSSYDNEDAVYIVVYDQENKHVGSLRILKPTSQWMIEGVKIFKDLLGGYQINKTASTIEVTRLLISTENRHLLGSMQASVRLFQGLYHWMMAEKFEKIYMVIRPLYFRFFTMEGFCPELIGISIPGIDGVACKMDMNITARFIKENRPDLWEWAMTDR